MAYVVDDVQTARRSLQAYALRCLGILGHGGDQAPLLVAAFNVSCCTFKPVATIVNTASIAWFQRF